MAWAVRLPSPHDVYSCQYQIVALIQITAMCLGCLCLQDLVSGQLLGPSYATVTRVCEDSSQCQSALAEICVQLYDGCFKGRCSCDEDYERDPQSGRCLRKKLGRGRCTPGVDRCPSRMECIRGTCQCVDGYMTLDSRYCLKDTERLIDDPCLPDHKHKCYHLQEDSEGYTTFNAECHPDHRICKCSKGFRQEKHRCLKRNIGEAGCLNDNQCKGDALCIDSVCQCPTDFQPTEDNTRCAKTGAPMGLAKGDYCNEMQHQGYCSAGLMCVQCPELAVHRKCAQYKFSNIESSGVSVLGVKTLSLVVFCVIITHWMVMR